MDNRNDNSKSIIINIIENDEFKIRCIVSQLYDFVVNGDRQDPIDKINDGKEKLFQLLMRLPKPLTVLKEYFYIDRSFRDTYYLYYSNQHFKTNRYSLRLSFFNLNFSLDQFYNASDKKYKQIEKSFMGICVLNPVTVGFIGRTLINPKFLIDEPKAYIRFSKYEMTILGRSFCVEAFPFRMQDQETMRCAEVTLINLMDYFSNSYNDYRTVAPSDIIRYEQDLSSDRVLPSQGIPYYILSKILTRIGFAPRIYGRDAFTYQHFSKIKPAIELRRMLHYYIESGIPVALNLSSNDLISAKHSIICIGHGLSTEALKEQGKELKIIPWDKRETAHPIINSADFYNSYVVMDDNQAPYSIRKFEELSLHNMQVSEIAVPMYKRMFMDAGIAESIIISLLNHEQFGINNWIKLGQDNEEVPFLKDKEDVIIRLFAASSRSFKKYRLLTTSNINVKQIYSIVPLPRFIWVCELYRVDDYDELKAFGEIIIDATSSANRGYKSTILMRYPGILTYRLPEEENLDFQHLAKLKGKQELFPGYRQNLYKINRKKV